MSRRLDISIGSLRVLTALLLLLACSACATAEPEVKIPAKVEREGSATAPPEADWPEVRERRWTERLARGEVATVVFEGDFLSGGLPTEDTRAIPLGHFDLSFILSVRVEKVLQGELPEGWFSPLIFAVHSPAMLFGMQGIRSAEGQHVPQGRFTMTLWKSPDGSYDLEIVPLAW